MIAMAGLGADDMSHLEAFGFERFGHDIGGLFLAVDFTGVSDEGDVV